MSVKGFRDYFEVLGVERGADADSIKKAFRKLARQYHPDVNPGDASAEAKFKEISEAYEVLSDPEKRRRYEQFGQYWSQMGGSGGGAGAAGFDVDFGRYGNFDDFINDLLGRFGGPRRRRWRRLRGVRQRLPGRLQRRVLRGRWAGCTGGSRCRGHHHPQLLRCLPGL
jgi:DnaJ-class molecular chaperone